MLCLLFRQLGLSQGLGVAWWSKPSIAAVTLVHLDFPSTREMNWQVLDQCPIAGAGILNFITLMQESLGELRNYIHRIRK